VWGLGVRGGLYYGNTMVMSVLCMIELCENTKKRNVCNINKLQGQSRNRVGTESDGSGK